MRTNEWLTHYFVERAGHLQKNRLLYSRRKQSQYQRFMEEPEGTQWEDRDPSSEYDTDIDEAVEKLTKDLKAKIDDLHALQEQQPPDKENRPVGAAGRACCISNAHAANGN